ncbi:MAG: hypothetical protein OXC48_07485 [Endozoicomonadaceae bacterium]|nr:hypothetical protein [Endozoicomonadaceae bacterium]
MVSAEILRTLADIGFMAVSGGLSVQAERIFKAIALCRKDNVVSYMGMALNLINEGKSEEALALLEKKALVLEPDNLVLHNIKAMALMFIGRKGESEACLQEVINLNTDNMATTLAQNMLEHLHKAN